MIFQNRIFEEKNTIKVQPTLYVILYSIPLLNILIYTVFSIINNPSLPAQKNLLFPHHFFLVMGLVFFVSAITGFQTIEVSGNTVILKSVMGTKKD
jgi:uncharacterized integral membrane protein